MDPMVASLTARTCWRFPSSSRRRSRRRRSSRRTDEGSGGQEEERRVLCPMCHLGGFTGQNEIPRVAGQHYDYVVKQLKDFKARSRTNDAGNMTSVPGRCPIRTSTISGTTSRPQLAAAQHRGRRSAASSGILGGRCVRFRKEQVVRFGNAPTRSRLRKTAVTEEASCRNPFISIPRSDGLSPVRDGLFVRELRDLQSVEVAHQGLRFPRDGS